MARARNGCAVAGELGDQSARSRAWTGALDAAVESVNRDLAAEIETAFAHTSPTTLVGTLRSSRWVPNLIARMLAALPAAPTGMRFGVGIGAIGGRAAGSGVEGSARSRAMQALETAKREACTVVYASGMTEPDRIMNTVLLLTHTIRAEWTDRQWQAYRAYVTKDGKHGAVASALGVSRPAITQMFRRMHLAVVEEAERIVGELGPYFYGL